MSRPDLPSNCRRLLFDAELLDQGRLPSLAEDPYGREIHLFAPGEAVQRRPGGPLRSVLSGEGRDEGLPLLRALHAEGRLAATLFVSAHERRLRLARQLGLASLDASEGELPERLSPRALVMRDTASLILRFRRGRRERYLLAGINGIDNSGKSAFSRQLAAVLESLGLRPQLLDMESFTAPKKARRDRDYPEAERYYRKHYAMDRLREQLLLPLQGGQAASVSYDHYDPARERVVEKRSVPLDASSALLLEGPFLFQEDLYAYFDFRIYLVTDFERAIELELEGVPEKKRRKHEERFVRSRLGAQSLYLRRESPWKRAHLVIRGVNTETPVIEDVDAELEGDAEKAMNAD